MEWRVLIIAQTFYLGFKRARLPSFGNTRCHIEAEEGLTAIAARQDYLKYTKPSLLLPDRG